MSFLTVLEKDITDVESAVIDGAKTVIDYIDNVVVHDLLPELVQALIAALGKFTQEEIAALLGSSTPPVE